MAGDLNVTWIHGSADCSKSTDPPLQVHQYDPDTYILRQSKCSEPGTPGAEGPSFEAPFMYLLFGKNRALLLDTGASHSAALFPLAQTIRGLRDARAAATGGPALPLLVVHSHSHGDHAAGDVQFQGQPDVTIAPLGLGNVKAFYHLPQWPNGTATIDLGDRVVDVLPAPGHEASHIVLYDRGSHLLLTGDLLYPGLLVVNDWAAYTHSVARLRAFAESRPVAHVLGGHVEMTNQAGHWFGYPCLFQPGEHVLELELRHVIDLDDALRVIGPHPRTDRRDDFIIYPASDPVPPL